ncbi:PG0541 family transporter-associated protein [Parabacteroides sp. PF5-9]|uniref:PG0541 family transporter-associated protein n=1 Tax=Parabacteroides sp. PF5-9 TaxID=1742404 RepID=UPI0024745358|nr:PG0541 family transporter-associated protein [Parabacteroides sp. PF5-9]MDH6356983.1 nitrogen regulatory protein PII [Parabacteroides sp. PF5-9]
MKAVFISFNQAYYEMILTIMDRNNIRGFTHWETVQGRGSKTGEPHFGSHAWPTLNSAIMAIVDDQKVAGFLDLLHKLDKQTEAQGLRAFVWNIEQTI